MAEKFTKETFWQYLQNMAAKNGVSNEKIAEIYTKATGEAPPK